MKKTVAVGILLYYFLSVILLLYALKGFTQPNAVPNLLYSPVLFVHFQITEQKRMSYRFETVLFIIFKYKIVFISINSFCL